MEQMSLLDSITNDVHVRFEKDTLSIAKDYILKNRDAGVSCPCCDRFIKVYKRSLHASMGYWLVRFYKAYLHEDRWWHINELCQNKKGISTGDYSYLECWGLLKHKMNEDSETKDSGLWKITENGIRFVKGEILMPKKAHILNVSTNVIDFSEEKVSIHDVLRKKFDYYELMRM